MLDWLNWELLGTVFAASGFTLLSFGRLKYGFMVGLVSCMILIPYFYENNQIYLLTLQCFFATMNIVGIVRNFAKEG